VGRIGNLACTDKILAALIQHLEHNTESTKLSLAILVEMIWKFRNNTSVQNFLENLLRSNKNLYDDLTRTHPPIYIEDVDEEFRQAIMEGNIEDLKLEDFYSQDRNE